LGETLGRRDILRLVRDAFFGFNGLEQVVLAILFA
jgi:hypothetical protein